MNKEIREQVISPEIEYSEKTLYLSADGEYVLLPRAEINIGDIKVLCSQEPDGSISIQTVQDGTKRLFAEDKDYKLKNGDSIDLQKIINAHFLENFDLQIAQNELRLQASYQSTREYVEQNYRIPTIGSNIKDLPALIQYLDPKWKEANKQYEVEITDSTAPELKERILRHKQIKTLYDTAVKRITNGNTLSEDKVVVMKDKILSILVTERDNLESTLRFTTSKGMYYYSNSFEEGKSANWNPRLVEIVPAEPLEPYIKPNIYEPMNFGPISGIVEGVMEATTGILERNIPEAMVIDNEPERRRKPNRIDKLKSSLNDALGNARKIAKKGGEVVTNNFGKVSKLGGIATTGALVYGLSRQGQMPEMAYNPTSPESNIPKTELNVEQKPLGVALPPPSNPRVDNRPDTTQVEKVKIATTEAQAKTKISFYRETPNNINTSVSQISEQINWSLALKVFDSIDKNKTFSTEFQRAGGYEGLKKIGAITESTLSGITTVEINMPRFKSIPTIPRKN
jgi:hypothetical protein